MDNLLDLSAWNIPSPPHFTQGSPAPWQSGLYWLKTLSVPDLTPSVGCRTHAYSGGELLKLGITVAKHTIQTYITQVRPAKPSSQTWSTFLKNHANAKRIWACDFLPVIGLWFRPLYLFFIIELASRRIVHFGVTRSPTDAWVAQQRRKATPLGLAPRFLIRDRDRKYGECFRRVAVGTSIEVLKTPYRAPKANAICERFLGGVRRECFDACGALQSCTAAPGN